MSRHLPSRIGRYEIAKLLGQGGLGPVYLALDPILDRHVAIKVLAIDDVDLAGQAARAAHAAAALTHPNIVTIYDIGEHEGRPFIAMEYVDGESVAGIISRGDLSMPLERRLELIQGLCDGLAYAHDQGVLHTNIQPGELFVTREGVVKVPLLGLARLRLGSSMSTGETFGTPQYLSPEQIKGQGVDGRSDVFSVGLILYEILTLKRAYSGDLPSLLRQILTAAPKPASELNAQIGPAIEAVIDKALQKEPSHRYQTMRAFATALARVRSELEPHSTSDTMAIPLPARPVSQGQEIARKRVAQIESAVREARSLETAGRYEEAIRACESALLLDPMEPQALDILERSEMAMEERNRNARPAASQSPEAVAISKRIDENVQFSVYRPPAIEPARWYSMLVFTHLSSRRPDAAPDEPDPLDEVGRRAKALLGNRAAAPASRVDALAAIPEEGQLRVVPHVPGIAFNPPEHTFVWVHSIHQVEFSLRADVAMQGRTARGSVDVYLGALAVAHIPLAIPVEAQVDPRERRVGQTANPYRKLFASYSHKDEVIVRQFENYARGLGDRYLRDVLDLRAGEVWNTRLCELIEAADVFQLFWSRNSMDSMFVRQEWEHALTVAKPDFIRPVYWEHPFPKREGLPSIDLSRLHFAFVGASASPVAEPGDRPADASMAREVTSEPEQHAHRAEEHRAPPGMVQGETARQAEARQEARRQHAEAEVRARPESEITGSFSVPDIRARESTPPAGAAAEQRAERQRVREETQIRAREKAAEAEFVLTPPSSPSPSAAAGPAPARAPMAAPPSVGASAPASRRLWFIVVALAVLIAAFLRWC